MAKRVRPADAGGMAEAPHFLGHRDRLRARFLDSDGEGLQDYELLELLLFRSIPRRDVKPFAKALIARFGTFAEVLAAPPHLLEEVEGIGAGVAADLKAIEAAGQRLARGKAKDREVLGSWKAV